MRIEPVDKRVIETSAFTTVGEKPHHVEKVAEGSEHELYSSCPFLRLFVYTSAIIPSEYMTFGHVPQH